MTTNTIEFEIGRADHLNWLFSWAPLVQASPRSINAVCQAAEHAFNQTLLRDGFVGAWASVYPAYGEWDDATVFKMRITSPDDDGRSVAPYGEKIPEFLSAMAEGLRIYEDPDTQAAIAKEKWSQLARYNNTVNGMGAKPVKDDDYVDPEKLNAFFLPPFGLSLLNSRCVQLLHYPPAETLSYMDYLYSPTNRRWENLLHVVGAPDDMIRRLETITDIGPIAADGGKIGGEVIEPVLDMFQPYAAQMLPVVLHADGPFTQPLVAFGGPVSKWLAKFYGDQLKAQGVKITTLKSGVEEVDLLQAFYLNFGDEGGPATPVLTANHPIKFNYFDKSYAEAMAAGNAGHWTEKEIKHAAWVMRDSFITLQQDLVAASWAVELGRGFQPKDDPAQEALQFAKETWMTTKNPDYGRIYEIFVDQVVAFMMQDVKDVTSEDFRMRLVEATQGLPDGL